MVLEFVGWTRANPGALRNLRFLALVLALCSWATSCLSQDRQAFKLADADSLPTYVLQARDPGVGRWIFYQIVGPSNHPYPILYFSTSSFETARNEFLTVLSKQDFEALSRSTKARIDQSDCPGEMPRSNFIWYTVQISRRDRGPVKTCFIPQNKACEYLFSMLQLAQRTWSADQFHPLDIFFAEVQCGATPVKPATADH
jgi:hypothetical protein